MADIYEGASTAFRMENKGGAYGPQDSLSAYALKRLWDRAHHLVRNNAGAATAKHRLQSNWIGTGIRVRWNNKKMQKLWDAFAEDPCSDGYGNLVNLQSLLAGALFESGEVFVRGLIQSDPTGKQKIPLKLQAIEAEMLDPTYTLPAENIRYGIKFAGGRPQTYFFFETHPGEKFVINQNFKRVPVPAENVFHIFSRERPGQWRGVTMLSSVMLPLYEMDELTDATLVRQKAAQAIAWIIKKKESGALPALGPVSIATQGDPQADGTVKQKKITKVLPGGVHYLNDDEDFTFASVEDIGNNLLTMLEHQWRLVASAMGLTYEQMTGDLSSVNFSSMRAGMIEFRRRCAMIQQLIFVNLFLLPLANWFQELAGVYVSKEMLSAKPKFILPKTDWPDPLKDAQADVLEIKAGLATLKAKLEERGEDFEDVIAQLFIEQGLDLVLESNPAAMINAPAEAAAANAPDNTDPTQDDKVAKKTDRNRNRSKK